MKKINISLFYVGAFLIALVATSPLAFASALSLVYDANGNLVTGDGKYRTYDGFNHLVQVRNGDNATATILENYTWHPIEDRILAKSVYETNGSWKEDVLYISKEYVIVDNASGSFDYRYYYQNGQLVVQEDYSGRKLFMHNDHLGSTSLITNESGAVVEQTFYEPFGEILSGGEASRYDYTGKEFDSVTGDYDFNARKMKAEWGVFETPDSVISNVYEPKDLNHYSYVRNNPYVYVDPNGKEPNRAELGTMDEIISYVEQVENDNPTLNTKQVIDIVANTYSTSDTSGSNTEPTTGYYFPKRYIYTEEAGFIDMMHFFKNAQATLNGESSALLFLKGYGLEARQCISEQSSCFSYEDLPSNAQGRSYADELSNANPTSGSSFASQQLHTQLVNMGGSSSLSNIPKGIFNQLPANRESGSAKLPAAKQSYFHSSPAVPKSSSLISRAWSAFKRIFK